MRFPEFSGEWRESKLGDISDIKTGPFGSTLHADDYVENGTPIITTEHFKKGCLPIIKDGLPQVSEKDRIRLHSYQLHKNDIVFSRVGSVDINAKVGEEQEGWLFSGRVLRVKLFSDNSDYIHYLLSTKVVKDSIASRAVGQTMPSINTQILANTPLIKSIDYAEQKKIGCFLSIIDERIATQSKIIEEQETLLKSLADKLFLQNNQSCQLSDIVNIVKGKQLNVDALSEEGEYYVMNGGITPSGYHSEYNVPAGAISISEGGNSCGYVQFNEKPFWSGGHCYSLQAQTDIVDYKFIYYFLKARQTDVMALRIGSGLPNIQKKDIEKFTVSFPPLQQQKKFVKALDAVSEKINTEKQLLENYRQQKDYLLSKMFI